MVAWDPPGHPAAWALKEHLDTQEHRDQLVSPESQPPLDHQDPPDAKAPPVLRAARDWKDAPDALDHPVLWAPLVPPVLLAPPARLPAAVE